MSHRNIIPCNVAHLTGDTMSSDDRALLSEIREVVTKLRIEAGRALNKCKFEKAEELNALADAWLCVDKKVRSA